jgi:protein-disulfide isomerase
MRSTLAAALAILACLCLGPPAGADEAAFTPAQRAAIVQIMRDALRADPSILRDAITALQEDDANLKEAAARAAIDKIGPSLTRAPGDPSAGDPKGDVTVVEFYDVRCPYCRRMLPIVAELLRGDPKIRLIYKDIPILGPASVVGAKAMLAAQRQGGYQRLHDIIMAGPPTVTEDTLRADARRAGLDWDRLRRDMADPAIEQRIDENLSLARALGIDGTPAYVIGAKLLPGALDLSELREAVAAARTR